MSELSSDEVDTLFSITQKSKIMQIQREKKLTGSDSNPLIMTKDSSVIDFFGVQF